jgi:hypothetical protein
MMRLSQNGDTLWDYQIPQDEHSIYISGLAVGSDDTVYLSQSYSVVAVSKTGLSTNILGMVFLFAINAVLIVLLFIYKRRNQRPGL